MLILNRTIHRSSAPVKLYIQVKYSLLSVTSVKMYNLETSSVTQVKRTNRLPFVIQEKYILSVFRTVVSSSYSHRPHFSVLVLNIYPDQSNISEHSLYILYFFISINFISVLSLLLRLKLQRLFYF